MATSTPRPPDKHLTAADYLIAALGRDGARLAAAALRAGWMIDSERAQLAPLAEAIDYLQGA